MLGLLVIGLAVAWIFVAKWVARTLSSFVEGRAAGRAVWAIVFAAVLALPLADEIATLPQYRAACSRYPRFQVEPSARGKTVYRDRQVFEYVAAPLDITVRTSVYVEDGTRKIQARYTDVYALGGWLSRALGVGPLMFQGSCFPPEPGPSVELFARYGVTYIQPHERRK